MAIVATVNFILWNTLYKNHNNRNQKLHHVNQPFTNKNLHLYHNKHPFNGSQMFVVFPNDNLQGFVHSYDRCGFSFLPYS